MLVLLVMVIHPSYYVDELYDPVKVVVIMIVVVVMCSLQNV
jgi:hypothetical protein